MTHIKAPYNFVPLNEKVVTPYWTSFVSHDVPFEDGLCGEFEAIITAQSPIFVKDGIGQEEAKAYFDDKRGQIKPFRFNHDSQGRFFIPGSSVKGMTSNVLEVLGFGYLGRKVNDVRYAIRDFSTNQDIYSPSVISKQVSGGWLKMGEDEKYLFSEGGPIRRIKHSEIEREYRIRGFAATGDKKSAKSKFDKLPETNPAGRFKSYKNKTGTTICEFDENGTIEGRVVVTGQPSDKKKKEFIFTESDNWKPVPDEVIKNFFFAYYDHDKNQQSDDWKHWKAELDRGNKIPIFYRRSEKSEKEKAPIKDMGLSMLYKIVYNNSVVESINHYQKNHDRDLAETIFGFIDKKDGLKGRVHFGHAYAVNPPEELNEAKEVLAGPKASYYPNYIRQDKTTGPYNTFMNEQPEISGWKRYPVHPAGAPPKQNPPPQDNEKIVTRFRPLAAGAKFKLTVRYHNLKSIELGALLSALTFHSTPNTFHSLGMGKPLGYGKVKLDVQMDDKERHLQSFECYMNAELGYTLPEWHILPQVQELVTMAQEHQTDKPEAQLEYMKLGMKREENEFAQAKNEGLALDRYSKLVGATAEIRPLSTPECIAKMKAQCAAEKAKLNNSKPLHELVEDYRSQLKKKLAEELKRQQKARIDAFRTQKETLQEEELRKKEELENQKRIETKAQRQAETQAQGLDLSGINPSGKNAFDDLKRAVEKYARDFHGLNDKQLKANFPDGYLPERDHDTVLKKIQEIHNAGKSPKQDVVIKKVAEWIGEDKAKMIIFE